MTLAEYFRERHLGGRVVDAIIIGRAVLARLTTRADNCATLRATDVSLGRDESHRLTVGLPAAERLAGEKSLQLVLGELLFELLAGHAYAPEQSMVRALPGVPDAVRELVIRLVSSPDSMALHSVDEALERALRRLRQRSTATRSRLRAT